MKPQFNYSDPDYRNAWNYEHNFYNLPITVTIGKDKYILPFGTSDNIDYIIKGNYIYFIGENSRLDYISCFGINTLEREIVQNVFISNVDEQELTESIFELSTDEQLNILSNYFE